MPKIISNFQNGKNPDDNKFPSSVCNLTSQGQLVTDQLYCCCGDNCNSKFDLSSCNSSCTISQCRNINTLDACQKRTDGNSQQVCNWKGDFFCLSDPSTDAIHKDWFETVKWSINRSKFEESINVTDPISNPSGLVTACYNGTGFQLDNGQGCDPIYGSVTCGDLFSSEYNCIWRGGGETLIRSPLGEVCEIIPITTATTTATVPSLVTSTVTSTVTETNFPNNLKIGLSTGFSALGVAAIGGFAWALCLRGKLKRFMK